MAPKKYDAVIEAVRYGHDRQVQVVRLYARLGDTYSDRRLVSRTELVKCLQSGQRIVAGQPVPARASTFEVTAAIRLKKTTDGYVLVSDLKPNSDHDWLEGVPLF